ncbi:hypothetical protein [Moorena sp. SIOASIH]|uniref:hypothetical protein n=1 Tax=Moorena sp. SIOASIH TaxID=2607817 RepID=UPI0025CD6710|nr:hypothetical protein [Moorena sp. SIOASIH]
MREVHDLMPEAIHELPKDDYQKLLETGQLEQDIDQEDLKRAQERYYQQPIKSVLDVIKEGAGQICRTNKLLDQTTQIMLC